MRITPACAGKSRISQHILPSSQDHPCVCREKIATLPTMTIEAGSPLRVQGKERIVIQKQDEYRITPACAGKSWGNNNGVWDV